MQSTQSEAKILEREKKNTWCNGDRRETMVTGERLRGGGGGGLWCPGLRLLL